MNALRKPVLLLVLLVSMSGLSVGPVALSAQDATPETTGAYPAHIHAGSCADLGDVAWPLNDIALAPEGGTPVASPTMMEEMHDEVMTSVTVVDVSLDELLAGDYAINVHAGADDMGTYIACGEVTGTVRLHRRSDAPAGLVIPLRQLDDSGYGGMAWLTPTSDGKTEVTVFLTTGFYGAGPMG
jgi:hypothetical protein